MPARSRKQKRGHTITVGNQVFQSKAKLRTKVRDMLQSGPREISKPGDVCFLQHLFKRHPQYLMKKGSGISEIHVKLNPRWHNYGFWMKRCDESWMDISYTECIKASPQTKRFASACRNAILFQINKYKRQHQSSTADLMCELCSCVIGPNGDLHVDHAEPLFKTLVSNFIMLYNLDIQKIAISSDDASKVECHDTFTDERLAQQFSDYHASYATLRMVHAQCNLRRRRS